MTTTAVFKVLGTTDEITECAHCGRVDLKGTIILGYLDADGSIEETTYFGAVCGAHAAGWTTKEIRKQATAADRAKVEAQRIERERAAAIESAHTQLLYGTAECPSGPTMCRYDRKYCVAHS